ncbi:hypothetical protein DW095_05920 [Bacteroides sp. AM07-16]|nr:hypothetical protein DW095_05920 [Bacteroides sp. AM07-16]
MKSCKRGGNCNKLPVFLGFVKVETIYYGMYKNVLFNSLHFSIDTEKVYKIFCQAIVRIKIMFTFAPQSREIEVL